MNETDLELSQSKRFQRFGSQRGITLFMTAAALVVLLGFIALAVDMGMLYTARADCQKIADAAALAGAKEAFFYTPTDPVATARTAAVSTARANYVSRDSNDNRLQNANIIVNTAERTVQVTVTRTAVNLNPVETYFGRALGITSVDVSAMATAEVYRPTVGGPPFGAKCIKPWLLPDLYDFGSGSETIDETDRGKNFNIKQGDSALSTAPGQYLIANMPQGSTPPLCPSCGDPAAAANGADLYRQNISCCNRNPIFCGVLFDFDTENGNKVGPTGQGVQCLIRQSNGNSGQDVLISPTPANPNGPLQIQPGANNPLSTNPSITTITDSDSLIILPMFDASIPITSGQSQVLIVGFMQVFIHYVGNPQNTVYTTIINVTRCTSGGGSGTPPPPGPITGAIGSPLPLRLVRNTGT